MDDLFEFILELIGVVVDAKHKHAPISENEPYCPAFVIRYKAKHLLLYAVLWVVIFVIGAALSYLEDVNSFWFMLVFLLCIGLLAFLYSAGNNCAVDERRLRRRRMFIFGKTVAWDDVICLRVIENTQNRSTTLALYGRDKKCCLQLSTPMIRLGLLIKMAEYRGVEIRRETNLTVNQMRRLP